MLNSLRNFAKTKIAAVFIFLIAIPFVFWGMGDVFSGGNTNNIAKINKKKISTQEFIDYINDSKLDSKVIKENLENNIIEELLSNLISVNLLNLEIEDFNILISEKTLLKKIKENKIYLNDKGEFERIKYEKFLLENNISASQFEKRLKDREAQKKLFDYIGAGTYAPEFLIEKFFEEKNKKMNLDFINLNNFYKKKENYTIEEIRSFINENEDKLKIEYIDFKYSLINPQNLIGTSEFNQVFFDKIDQIEIDISNEVSFEKIIDNNNLKVIDVKNFRFSDSKNEIEKKIFDLRNNEFDIFENEDQYILYKVNKVEQKKPDIKDKELKKEITELLFQKDKFEFNQNLIEKINNNQFDDKEFDKFGQNNIEKITLNSIRDNKKFEINSVKLLYSLPKKSISLVNDENNNVYLVKINNFETKILDKSNDVYKSIASEQNSKTKKEILQSYDIFLNEKYNVVLNQKTIDRVKNFFQ